MPSFQSACGRLRWQGCSVENPIGAASDEVLDELGIENPFELSGLYSGVHIGHRSVLDPTPGPSRIFLYRRAILDEWAERGDVTLAELVSHVLVHEIGHHFGLSDDDIHAIEDAAE